MAEGVDQNTIPYRTENIPSNEELRRLHPFTGHEGPSGE